jgi:REP element-mobilizing transposase RayT
MPRLYGEKREYRFGRLYVLEFEFIMALYKNKYRIESARLKEWDYSNPWYYYVTINTKDHKCWFGKVKDGKMILDESGMLVKEEWERTGEIRKNIDLDYYVIMPNHIHGIIVINEVAETTGSVVSNDLSPTCKNSETMQRIVSTTLQANSLGSIIGQFNSICAKRIHKNSCENFAWQSGFYDRIIRNEKELYNIRKYIEENPIRWEIEKTYRKI